MGEAIANYGPAAMIVAFGLLVADKVLKIVLNAKTATDREKIGGARSAHDKGVPCETVKALGKDVKQVGKDLADYKETHAQKHEELIEKLGAIQAATTTAIGELGTRIAGELGQVRGELNELSRAVKNGTRQRRSTDG